MQTILRPGQVVAMSADISARITEIKRCVAGISKDNLLYKKLEGAF